MEDIEVWKQMYRIVFVAGDRALTMLENMRIQEAMETLQSALIQAEDLYIAADGMVDERTEHTMETYQSALAQTREFFADVARRVDEISAYMDNQDYTSNKDKDKEEKS